MSDLIKHVGDSDFEAEVNNSGVLTLVDFWAPWCGPCKAIGPVLEELAPEYDGKCKFTKVNTDENQAVAMKFGIRSIPTLILIKDGKIVDTRIGALSKEQMKGFIDGAL